MVIATANTKGGVGKSTTAAHLALYLNGKAPTLLLDGDPTRNVTNWHNRGVEAGRGFGFEVAPVSAAAKLAARFKHVVIDSGQRPTGDDLQELIDSCDLLILPVVPLPLETDGLVQTIQALQELQDKVNYKVLLVKVPPAPQRDGPNLRAQLEALGVPLFKAEIPLLKIYATAAGDGLLVNQTKDRNTDRAWEAYAAVGRELKA